MFETIAATAEPVFTTAATVMFMILAGTVGIAFGIWLGQGRGARIQAEADQAVIDAYVDDEDRSNADAYRTIIRSMDGMRDAYRSNTLDEADRHYRAGRAAARSSLFEISSR